MAGTNLALANVISRLFCGRKNEIGKLMKKEN
jgi:hypothetical protein